MRSHMWCHQELTLPMCMWQTLMWHWHEQKSSRIKQTFVLMIVPSSSSNSVYFCALWGFLMFLTRELNLIASLGSGFARTSRRNLLSTARISYGLCSTPTSDGCQIVNSNNEDTNTIEQIKLKHTPYPNMNFVPSSTQMQFLMIWFQTTPHRN